METLFTVPLAVNICVFLCFLKYRKRAIEDIWNIAIHDAGSTRKDCRKRSKMETDIATQ